jgi:hypothetical protein
MLVSVLGDTEGVDVPEPDDAMVFSGVVVIKGVDPMGIELSGVVKTLDASGGPEAEGTAGVVGLGAPPGRLLGAKVPVSVGREATAELAKGSPPGNDVDALVKPGVGPVGIVPENEPRTLDGEGEAGLLGPAGGATPTTDCVVLMKVVD